ncbi:tripartite tricarboxylate transporter TctB family protein [Treponema sp. HNW]|uniref:tripartite tricarboxylate transporter TctB family protein n=1 Tax=Treponema sp. HNW TaxID=3116654 RepID=UPI003D0A0567
MTGNKIPSLLFFIVAILFIIPALSMGLVSTTSDKVPGAGFFPFLLGISLAACTLLLFIRSIKEKQTIRYFELTSEKKENLNIMLMTLFVIVVTLVIWKLFKIFYPIILLECFILSKFLYKRTWIFSTLFSTLLIALIYIGFTIGLTIKFIA